MTTTKTNRRKFKVHLIIEGGRWPYVGNAFENADGSFAIYLDEDVELTGGQKLRMRPAFGGKSAGTTDRTPPRAAAAPAVAEDDERMPANHPPAHMMF